MPVMYPAVEDVIRTPTSTDSVSRSAFVAGTAEPKTVTVEAAAAFAVCLDETGAPAGPAAPAKATAAHRTAPPLTSAARRPSARPAQALRALNIDHSLL